MPNEKILVVDENEATLKLVSFVLLPRGYEVRHAYSAEEALTAIEKEYPDLLLIDLELRGAGGLSLARMLKSDLGTRDLVIIGLSENELRREEHQHALDSGCSGYFAKPLDTSTFADAVARYLPLHS
jgi:CheY-like chemotaxis protein